jgi:hypothetical protein
MSNDPARSGPHDPDEIVEPLRHPSERARAVRAAVLGAILGAALRLVSRRRSA